MRHPLTIFVSHPSDFITDYRSHGDGRIAYEQVQHLAERGHRLHVAYTSADLDKPLHKNVTLHKIVCRFPSSTVQELEYLFRVRQLFRRLQQGLHFDLIHQFHPVFAGRSALLTRAGVPLVIGLFFAPWPTDAEAVPATIQWRNRLASLVTPFLYLAEWRQQRHAACLLLSTPAAESRLFRLARAKSRHVLLWGPGIDAEYYAPIPSKEESGSASILFLGNLERRKGVFVLAEAFRAIWRQCPQARLMFVGDGSQRGTLERLIEEDESKVNVDFCGELRGDNKKSALLAAKLVAIPSFGEPYGLVALEAMACAKPIVATRAGGLQYLVPPEGGRLVPPGDAPALARIIIELLAQPGRLKAMGEFNRKLVLERFDWQKVIERLEEVYYSVL